MPFVGTLLVRDIAADGDLRWLGRHRRELGPVPNVRTLEKCGWRAPMQRDSVSA